MTARTHAFHAGDVVRHVDFHASETTAGYITHINDDMIHVYFAMENMRMCFREEEIYRGVMTWHGPIFPEEIV